MSSLSENHLKDVIEQMIYVFRRPLLSDKNVHNSALKMSASMCAQVEVARVWFIFRGVTYLETDWTHRDEIV